MIEQLLAHLIGDYVLQSHWMATNKTARWWPAIVHAAFYTLPFVLFFPTHPWAWLVIGSTHAVIDRYRLARYLVWFKNYVLSPLNDGHDCDTPTGFPFGTPDWLAFWLLIIVDNTMHLCINYAALRWL